jgi:hypothetical protein
MCLPFATAPKGARASAFTGTESSAPANVAPQRKSAAAFHLFEWLLVDLEGDAFGQKTDIAANLSGVF